MARPALPSFRGLQDIGGLPGRDVLARATDGLRRGDPATAWLIADFLVRKRDGAEAAPYLIRAAALAKLGDAEAARGDVAQAVKLDPYDRAVSDAVLAVGSAVDREKALRRLIDSAEARIDAGIVAAMRRTGHCAVVVCAASDEGIHLSGWAVERREIELDHRGEAGAGSVRLACEEPSRGEAGGFAGTALIPWDDADMAGQVIARLPDVLVHPGVVLRPDNPQPQHRVHPTDEAISGRGLLIVVPVYDDLAATTACFNSLAANLPTDRPVRIIAVDDVTPDPEIAALMDRLAQDGSIELIRNRVNLGFAASVNRALRLRRPGEDVVLLNADTLVPPNALGRLHDLALADPTTGTLTPLSNNGEDTSLPVRFAANALGSLEEVGRLNELAWGTNGGRLVAMPNGVGFCMLIAAPLLARRPLLPIAFGRGYYEDVAYCLSARALGFSNLCATGVYVGHDGSRSFKGDKPGLVKRNLKRLSEHFPDYRKEADAFFAGDPLKADVARLERAWLAQMQVVLVLAASGTAARVGLDQIRAVADASAPVVIAVGEGGHVALRGAEGGWPQNLDPLPTSDPLLEGLAKRAVAIVLIDPHRLRPELTALAASGHARRAVIVASGPLVGGSRKEAATNIPASGAVHASGCRLADIWQAAGFATKTLPSGTPQSASAAFRDDALYLLPDPQDADSRALCRRLGWIWSGEAPGGASLVAFGPGDKTADGMTWLGDVTLAAFAAWTLRAGAAPVLLASRLFGCGDPRLDGWLAEDHPVAFFEPGLGRPVAQGRALALPADLSDEEVAVALAAWLQRLARDRAA